MEKMKQLVRNLLSDSSNTVFYLQQINEALLKEYELHHGSYLSIQPLQVEIYYVNFQAKPPFVDTNMQCMSVNSQIDSEIWRLQSNHFGKLYFHLRGHGGIDVCLSDSGQYALCSTIKSARINGEDVWGQSKVCERVMQIICEHENVSKKEEIAYQINSLGLQTISRREKPEKGYVYHIKRRLRRLDKNNSLPLLSFMDIWNKKLALTNMQRINIYMAAHPTENALDVIREQGFHSIPTEVRIKYGISRKTHL
ncbi:MAG: hypothetical protein Q4D36_08205, partial [Bacteroidales bacterium]|nr:hypothetical protein [Bacteroidales bacterium]